MRRGGGKGRDSCVVPFHTIVTNNLTGGSASLFVTPTALSSRAGTEADTWAHFRVKRLMFRLLPQTGATSLMVAGYIGGVQDTPPGTVGQLAEVLPSCIKGVGQTCPTEWIKVQKTDLAGPFPWYKSVAGSADPTEESPGALIILGNDTDPFILEVRGVFEFKTAVSTANTPAMIQLRQKVREERIATMTAQERAVLLKILGSDSGKSTQANSMRGGGIIKP